jgi:hypothetical protein
LHATLTPFVRREKPQVFPAPAASLVKNGRAGLNLYGPFGFSTAVVNWGGSPAPAGVYLFLLDFLAGVRGCGSRNPQRERFATATGERWNCAALTRGNTESSLRIATDRHNFATGNCGSGSPDGVSDGPKRRRGGSSRIT